LSIVNGYCSLAEVKAASASVAAHGTANDAVLERCIEAASRGVDQFTHRRFYTNGTAEVRVYAATNYEWIDVDDLASDTFTLRTSTTLQRDYSVTWGTADYQAEPLNRSIEAGPSPITRLRAIGDYSFTVSPISTVQVTGTFGYGTAVPTEVTEATILLSLRRFARLQSPTGVQSGEFGPVYISRRTDPDVAATLDRLRRSVIGVA
jgi:hypothetical protein